VFSLQIFILTGTQPTFTDGLMGHTSLTTYIFSNKRPSTPTPGSRPLFCSLGQLLENMAKIIMSLVLSPHKLEITMALMSQI